MTSEKPTAAFVLSLLAGIFIILGGGVTSMMGSLIRGPQGGYGGYGYGGMMGGYNGYGGYGWMFNMMNGYGYNGYGGFRGMMNNYGFYGMMRGLGIGFGYMGLFGVVFGLIVIVGALMLYSRPSQHTTWGVLIIVFSVLSLFGGMMSGLGLGLILGVIGGALAIIWKPSASSASHP
jgi:hypothetical protein